LFFLIPSPNDLSYWIALIQYHVQEKIAYFQNLYDAIIFIYLLTVGTWGLLILFFPLFNKKETWINWIKLYGVFMIVVYVPIIQSTSVERHGVVGFFPMILLALYGITNMREKWGVKDYVFIIIACIHFVFYLVIFPWLSEWLVEIYHELGGTL